MLFERVVGVHQRGESSYQQSTLSTFTTLPFFAMEPLGGVYNGRNMAEAHSATHRDWQFEALTRSRSLRNQLAKILDLPDSANVERQQCFEALKKRSTLTLAEEEIVYSTFCL